MYYATTRSRSLRSQTENRTELSKRGGVVIPSTTWTDLGLDTAALILID